MLLVGVSSAASIITNAAFPTKIDHSLNVSTVPVYSEILPNGTTNSYYYLKTPNMASYTFKSAKLVSSKTGINYIQLLPITGKNNLNRIETTMGSSQSCAIKQMNYSGALKNETICETTPIFTDKTVPTQNISISSNTLTANGNSEYLILINSPSWKSFSWGYSDGPFSFDPDAFCGGTISSAGTYNMTENCLQNGTAITISAANVALDCKGFSIIGNNTASTYGITYNNLANINITNCNIVNYTDGIRISGTGIGGVISYNNITGQTYGIDIPAGQLPRNLQIHHNNISVSSVAIIPAGRSHTISSNYFSGANQYGTVLAYDLNGTTLDNNTVISTGAGNKGIYFYPYTTDSNVGYNTISNTFVTSSDHGIDFDNYCQYCNVLNTTIIGTNASSKYGVRTDQDGTHITNSIISNYSTGVIVRDNSAIKGVRVENSTISSTASWGIYMNTGGNHSVNGSRIDGCIAISIDSSWSNITNNILNGTCGTAITVQNTNGNDLITNNTANGYGNYAGQATGAGNTWTSNNFTSASTYTTFRALGTTNDAFYDNIFNNTNSGSGFRDDSGPVYHARNTYVGASGFALTSATASATYVNSTIQGIAYISGSSNILNNSFATSYIQLAGGTGIQINGVNINSTSHGIYISSGSGHIVDCMGGTLRGNNASSLYGLYSDQNNITVKNCIITNFTDAIRINGGDNSNFQNVNASTTKTGSYSINFLAGSENNTIRNSTLFSIGTAVAVAATANNNTVLNNNITSAVWVNNANLSSNFNDSSSGNIYYNSTGAGAWTFGNGTSWTSSTGNGYADGGILPLNATTFSGFWVGLGGDYHPYNNIFTPAVFPLNITFVSQSPPDINSTNVIASGVNISYNITYSINTTHSLIYKTNSTSSDCPSLVNGTAICGWENATGTLLPGNITNWSLDDNAILPSDGNLNQDTIENTVHSSLTMGVNDLISVELLNISSSMKYGWYEIMINGTGTGAIRTFYCNSTYTSGSPLTDGNCQQIASFLANQTYNHQHGNSSHQIISFSPVGGKIGNVLITPTSYFITKGAASSTEYAWYVPLFSRTGAAKTSSNGGNSWTNQSYTFDAHIHQFYNTSSIYYYVCANATNGSYGCSELRNDSLELGGLPPTDPTVLTPTNTTYNTNNTINITWMASVSPNEYSITYNVSLLQADKTFNKTINGSTNLTYQIYNATQDGQWVISVRACDALNQCTISYSNIFTVAPAFVHAPFITFINAYPSSAFLTDNLYCNITGVDMQDLLLNASYEWYKNGINQTTLAGSYQNLQNSSLTTISTVGSGNLSYGEDWSCRARLFDGIYYSDWNMSANISTIGNTPPEIQSIQVLPNPAFTSDTLNCYIKATDAESSSLTIFYEWYFNGTNQTSLAGNFSPYSTGTNTSISSVSMNSTTIGNWSCNANAYDGNLYSGWTMSVNSTVSSPPAIEINTTVVYPANNTDFGPGQCWLLIQTNTTDNLPVGTTRNMFCTLFKESDGSLLKTKSVAYTSGNVASINFTISADMNYLVNCTAVAGAYSNSTGTYNYTFSSTSLCSGGTGTGSPYDFYLIGLTGIGLSFLYIGIKLIYVSL